MKPLSLRKALNFSLLHSVSTDLYGLVGNPIASATYAAVGAAGSDAYAIIPSTASAFAILRIFSLSVVLSR